MAAPIVNASSIPLTGTAVVTQGCVEGLIESSPPTSADWLNSSSRPGFFLLDLRSQSPPDATPDLPTDDATGGSDLPTSGNFLPLLFLAALRQQPDPTVLPPGAGTGSAPSSDAPAESAKAVTAASADAPPPRASGTFEPLLRTAHRVIELLQSSQAGAADSACAAPAPSAGTAPSDVSNALKPALDATAAIAQAAPDALAALLKRMAPESHTDDSKPTTRDSATYMPLVQRTDAAPAASPSAAKDVQQLIDSLPKPIVVDQAPRELKDTAAQVKADSASAPLFVDGHALRAHAAAPADASATTLRLDVPMRSPEWAQALGEKITWLVDQNLSSAQIKLNPPQLGPIEVRIAVSGDSTQVSVSAHNLITRDALEAAAPRLREALTSHGFGSVSVDISQQSFTDRPMAQSHAERWEPWQALAAGNRSAENARTVRWQARGQLDAYA
jgi:flagellar hook-length control protein FliK